MPRDGIIFMFLLPLFVAACGRTAAELREDPRETATVHSNLTYAEVVRNVVRRASQCYSGGINAAWYETKLASNKIGSSSRIDVIGHGATTATMLSIDMVATSSGTDVTYYAAWGIATADFRPAMEEWIKGIGNLCHGRSFFGYST